MQSNGVPRRRPTPQQVAAAALAAAGVVGPAAAVSSPSNPPLLPHQSNPTASIPPFETNSSAIRPQPPENLLAFGGIQAHRPGYVAPDTSDPSKRRWRTDDEVAKNPQPISAVSPERFLTPPQSPEIHFIDRLGITIPGVCDRPQCSVVTLHEVARWRLHDWPEYTTRLAEHGVTYEDYLMVMAGVVEITQRAPHERATDILVKSVAFAPFTFGASLILPFLVGGTLTSLPKKGVVGAADDVKKFLKAVTAALQQRGVPVTFKLKKPDFEPVYQSYEVVMRHTPCERETVPG